MATVTQIEKRIELLSKPLWSYKDIMEYFPHIKSPTTANDLKGKIQKDGGGVPYDSRVVKTECVLKHFGLSRQDELKMLMEIANEN